MPQNWWKVHFCCLFVLYVFPYVHTFVNNVYRIFHFDLICCKFQNHKKYDIEVAKNNSPSDLQGAYHCWLVPSWIPFQAPLSLRTPTLSPSFSSMQSILNVSFFFPFFFLKKTFQVLFPPACPLFAKISAFKTLILGKNMSLRPYCATPIYQNNNCHRTLFCLMNNPYLWCLTVW